MKGRMDRDRQARFEKIVLDIKSDEDWLWNDEDLDKLAEMEYRMYEVDCKECLQKYD